MKVIQLELNEISKEIIDKMISLGKLKNFKYINENYRYVTTKSEEQYEHIEPWILWVSAHTGKTFDEHQVFHLGDVDQLKYPQIWETLYKNGIKSVILGSMNVKQGVAKEGIFFPDPWAKGGSTHPADLQPLWNLVANKVQTHATSKLSFSDLLNGVRCCLKYKIPYSLYFKIVKQIIHQKLNKKMKWRMPALFDELLSGIFLHILDNTDCGYHSLFLNACAHYQHHYWRNFEPERFDPSIVSPDVGAGDDPISYGYRVYDTILGKILEYVSKQNDVLLLITSAFSQEAYVDKENQGGMNYYRLNDHHEFVRSIGLMGLNVYPMMSRDWQVDVTRAADLDRVSSILSSIKLSDEALFKLSINSNNSLFIETAITRAVREDELITSQGTTLGKFNEIFTNIAIKSGHHRTEGSLWLSRDIEGFELKNRDPITALYPLTLAALGVKA